MCHCEYEKCRKEGGILQKFGYLKNKRCFLVEILNALGFIKITGISFNPFQANDSVTIYTSFILPVQRENNYF